MSAGTDGGEFLAEVEAVADRLIREAVERGDFDDLAGSGKPIANLEASRDPDWWARAWLEREQIPVPLRQFGEMVEVALTDLSRSSDEFLVSSRLRGLNRTIAAVQSSYPEFVLTQLSVEETIRAWRRGEMPTDYEVKLTS